MTHSLLIKVLTVQRELFAVLQAVLNQSGKEMVITYGATTYYVRPRRGMPIRTKK